MKFNKNKSVIMIHTKANRFVYKKEIEGLNKLLFQTKDFIKKKYNPDGFNVGINSGKEAGQSIMHCHIHLIPRREGDVENPQGGVRGVIPSKQHYIRKSK